MTVQRERFCHHLDPVRSDKPNPAYWDRVLEIATKLWLPDDSPPEDALTYAAALVTAWVVWQEEVASAAFDERQVEIERRKTEREDKAAELAALEEKLKQSR